MNKAKTTKSMAGLFFLFVVAAAVGLAIGTLLVLQPRNTATEIITTTDTFRVTDTLVIEKPGKEVIKYLPPITKTSIKIVTDTVLKIDTLVCIDTIRIYSNLKCCIQPKEKKWFYIRKFRVNRWPEHGPLWEMDSVREK